jgi:benzoyl-CoA reductase/2-hydroxyglutaryl-CoA dehydratase subunit BcrC/BadD/HgdB
MGIIKTRPIKKIINGKETIFSETIVVINVPFYKTNGESTIVVKNSNTECVILLDETTTEHITVKSMSDSIVKTDKLIDEQYEEIRLEKFASVELRFINNYWYVMSSDGLKNS